MASAKSYGPHKVLSKCISDIEVLKLATTEAVNILYCDPPWSSGVSKMFATMNRKANEGVSPDPLSFDVILSRLMKFSQSVDGYVMIEMGKEHHHALLEIMRSQPHLKNVELHEVEWPSGRKQLKAWVVIASTGSYPKYEYPIQNINGDWKMTSELLANAAQNLALPSDQITVFDPCCGLGITAKSALQHGLRFVGNEFNPARLEKTIKILRAAL
jgi:hypothetical protein